jgi:hypothetical protein
MGASNDFATLTMTGVKKTQKISYMNSPACILYHQVRIEAFINLARSAFQDTIAQPLL